MGASRHWQIYAAVVLISATIANSTLSAAQQPAARSVMTTALFWKACDQRHTSAPAHAACFYYVMGQVDAAITIGKFAPSQPKFCLSADSLDGLLERILSYMPSTIRNGDGVGEYVQTAILKAMKCE